MIKIFSIKFHFIPKLDQARDSIDIKLHIIVTSKNLFKSVIGKEIPYDWSSLEKREIGFCICTARKR